MSTAEAELFDSTEYRIPYPTQDGHEVEQIRLQIGGGYDLDRNNEHHAKFATGLTLGRRLLLTDQDGNQFYAYVAGKPAFYKIGPDGEEHVRQTISLVLEGVTIA